IILAIPKYGLKAVAFPFLISRMMPEEYGYYLSTIYSLWIIIMILLYAICNWFLSYKARSQKWWLKFL
ncbi:MAG: hypothetical protein SWJ54_21570, partial [Cyanobacteriota bacterium]|nr:hypothetical protein [Cyanobacteriota bacterium]